MTHPECSPPQRLKNEEILLYQPSQVSGVMAELAYTEPTNLDANYARFNDHLDRYCRALDLDQTDLHVRHRLNRARHSALIAPFFHMVELEADKFFLQAMDAEKLDLTAYTLGAAAMHETRYTYKTEAYIRFLRIAGAVNNQAAQKVMGAVTSTPTHPYRPLWDLYTGVYRSFVQTEEQCRSDWRGRPDDPAESIKGIVTYTPEETTLKHLVRHMEVLEKHSRFFFDRDAMLLELVRRSEEMSWGSTAKRSMNKHFPHPEQDEEVVEETLPVIAACPHSSLWLRSSLNEGPMDIPGFCPASSSYELRPPLLIIGGRETVEAMFAVQRRYTSRPRRIQRVAGAGSAAELQYLRDAILFMTLMQEVSHT